LKNKTIRTVCQYEEFGFDGYENRLLKKALLFVQRYLPALRHTGLDKYSQQILGYVMPAFYLVSDDVDVNEIKQSKPNIFYREYAEGLSLAKLILRRFGYNITRTEQKGKIKTPPFWIDMSKLFELYVLALLRERFNHKELTYHFTTNWQELDYLINAHDFQFVADAKYRAVYKSFYDKDDIRQLSGYARMQSVYHFLKKPKNEVIDCLIIYPDPENGYKSLKEVCLKETSIEQFVNFYKVPVSLPLIKNGSMVVINETDKRKVEIS
jgi:5-methylcytosine-specific restriction enzyme subunit McrC